MDEKLFCITCNKELVGRQRKYCCKECKIENLGNYYDREKAQIAQNKKRLERKLFLLEKYDFKCSKCGYDQNISALDFHHIDPNTKKFTLDGKNLTSKNIEDIFIEAEKCIVLCANCHREHHNPQTNLSQLNYKSENVIKFFVKYAQEKDTIPKEKNFCKKCGKELLTSDAEICQDCHHFLTRKVEWPTKEELNTLILTKSLVAISKIYGVSDNNVRRWCKNYDLPYKLSDIKKYKELNNR